MIRLGAIGSTSLRVLMYHRIVDPQAITSTHVSVVSATPTEFSRQMRVLQRRYQVVSAEEVIAGLRQRRPLPRKAVLLTFDDAYSDFGQIAWPILRRYRLPATLFVATSYPADPARRFWWDRLAGSFCQAARHGAISTPCGVLPLGTPKAQQASLSIIRRYLKSIPHIEAMTVIDDLCFRLGEAEHVPAETLSWDELRELASDGVSIGAHTRTHPALTQLPLDAARAEIRGSREDVLHEIGRVSPIFSYPFGDHDLKVAKVAREEGFDAAVTCRTGHNNVPGTDAMLLRRTDITMRTRSYIFDFRLTRIGAMVDEKRLALKSGGAACPKQRTQKVQETFLPITAAALGIGRGVHVDPHAREARQPSSGPTATSDVQTKYLRGSSLLLFGRVLSVLINLAVQVITIRYLAKTDYGAFAYALAVASMGSSAIHLGLDKALPRLLPIYLERDDVPRVFGSIWLVTTTTVGLGLALVLLLHGLKEVIGGNLVADSRAMSLLLVLIALSPLQAYTTILETLVAVFAGAKGIFLRRHIVGPGMKLLVVMTVVAAAGDVHMLAYGYLAGAVIGIWLYTAILLREWRKQDLLHYLRPRNIAWPAREVFAFGLPLYCTQLSWLLRKSLPVLLLEYFRNPSAVADYRAVVSIAGLNLVVYDAFYLLFVPAASRMYARADAEGISDMFWKTARWIAVLTLPVFLVTFSLAEPITVLLFGAEYVGAGVLLAILAAGQYIHAALGFNAAALRVHGKLRLILLADLLATGVAVVLALVLIPRYGAVGAAVSTTVTVVLHNVINHGSLWVGKTGIRLFEWRFLRLYGMTVTVAIAMLVVHRYLAPPVAVGIVLAACASLVVLRVARRDLDVEATFPEIGKIPLLRSLIT
jgi:O-antigen/teichoic acid export membrane protein/peptidoglycan/xylan/chitin deacetylase (PgdA/CDA1 family)